ncbi:MAG: PD40 domain-containing protein [Bdellovibrionales bacterium]|nr:PD40 domain-containing protein [Bdellovibrionales bacterium]
MKTVLSLICQLGFVLAVTVAPPVTQATADENELLFFGLKEGRLAFTAVSDSDQNIYMVDFARLQIRPLIATKSFEAHPRWSPDGTKLLYQSNQAGSFDIWIANSDGSSPRRLTEDAGDEVEAAWSPDGTQIVFEQRRPGSSDLVVLTLASGERKVVVSGRHRNTDAAWSPRGGSLLYASDKNWPGSDLFLLDLASGKTDTITEGSELYAKPAWHPDGARFAFTHNKHSVSDIYVLEKGATEPRVMAQDQSFKTDPAWISSGEGLFFVRAVTPNKDPFELWFIGKASGGAVRVMKADYSVRHPSWTDLPELSSFEPQEEESAPENNAEKKKE